LNLSLNLQPREGEMRALVIGWRHGHRRERPFRAIMEAIGDELRLAMEVIQAATGERIHDGVILGEVPGTSARSGSAGTRS
jgi:hypothetical protein